LVSLFPKAQAAVPNISVGSLTTLSGSESGDGVAASLSHTFTGNFTWMKGNHNVRFGPEFRVYRVFSDRHSADNSPVLSFNSLWGRGPFDTLAPRAGRTALLLRILAAMRRAAAVSRSRTNTWRSTSRRLKSRASSR
jgi:hypothetical protein